MERASWSRGKPSNIPSPEPGLGLNLSGVTVEWNARKAAANLKKHRLTFEEAATVFLDPLAVTFPDPDHSLEELREITIGCTMKGRIVFVCHCEREERTRMISARFATRNEQKQYEEGIGVEEQ